MPVARNVWQPILVESHPAPAPLDEVIFHLHRDDRSHTGKRVDHERDQGAAAEVDNETGFNGIKQSSNVRATSTSALSTGVLPFPDGELGAA